MPGPVEDLMTDAGALERAGFLARSPRDRAAVVRSVRLSRTFLFGQALPRNALIKRTAAGTRRDSRATRGPQCKWGLSI